MAADPSPGRRKARPFAGFPFPLWGSYTPGAGGWAPPVPGWWAPLPCPLRFRLGV